MSIAQGSDQDVIDVEIPGIFMRKGVSALRPPQWAPYRSERPAGSRAPTGAIAAGAFDARDREAGDGQVRELILHLHRAVEPDLGAAKRTRSTAPSALSRTAGFRVPACPRQDFSVEKLRPTRPSLMTPGKSGRFSSRVEAIFLGAGFSS